MRIYGKVVTYYCGYIRSIDRMLYLKHDVMSVIRLARIRIMGEKLTQRYCVAWTGYKALFKYTIKLALVTNEFCNSLTVCVLNHKVPPSVNQDACKTKHC
jgi:hypothetical protein